MYRNWWLIDASKKLGNTPKVNYNIQMSFKRVPNGKKNKMDHWSFWKNLGRCSRIFLSILATMGAYTNLSICLLARCSAPPCGELMHSSYRRVYSANVANPYTGVRSTHRQRPPLLSSLCLLDDWPSERILPLNYKFLGLEFACLTLLATEPKLGIRGRRNWSWLEVDPQFITRVWKRLIESKRLGNIEVITWTILWSSEQNAVQIISLMFVNEKWKCDGNENVMLNERETKLLGQENNNPWWLN